VKEMNLGTKEVPCPIYVSSLLTQEEEKEYFDLLSEYKDVFAWSYKRDAWIRPKSCGPPLVHQKERFT